MVIIIEVQVGEESRFSKVKILSSKLEQNQDPVSSQQVVSSFIDLCHNLPFEQMSEQFNESPVDENERLWPSDEECTLHDRICFCEL